MVRHYRRKNKECVLEINENRIILSNPSIQPFNEYFYASKNDILYFYYDLKLQFCTNYWYFNGLTEEERKKEERETGKIQQPNWVTIANGYVYEFGAIVDLPKIIDEVIKSDPDIEGLKKYFYEHRDKVYSKTDYESRYEINCTGLCEEDSYIITKVHRHFENSYRRETNDYGPIDYYWYEIYIGVGSEGLENTVGFRNTKLYEQDLLIIKDWANDFLELGKEIKQKRIEKMFDSEEDKYSCDPKWFKGHMMKNYPEDFHKWKEIWIKLYNYDFIRDEYWNYVKGVKIDKPLFSQWQQEDKVVAQELIQNGMKDWEAYLVLVQEYEESQKRSHQID